MCARVVGAMFEFRNVLSSAQVEYLQHKISDIELKPSYIYSKKHRQNQISENRHSLQAELVDDELFDFIENKG